MEISIKGDPEEIAALVVAIQERRSEISAPVDSAKLAEVIATHIRHLSMTAAAKDGI